MEDPVAELGRRVRRGAGRSPLRRWLTARRDDLLPVLGVPGQDAPPDWHTVTEVLSKVRFAGRLLTDGGGKALTPDRVRKTWWLVVQAGPTRPAERREPPRVEMLRPTAPRAPEPRQETDSSQADEKIGQLMAALGRGAPRLPRKVD
jgi:hypothetical protein